VLELLRDFGGAPRSLLREPEAFAPSFPEEEAPADIEALLALLPSRSTSSSGRAAHRRVRCRWR
jgi:hypothetical protein